MISKIYNELFSGMLKSLLRLCSHWPKFKVMLSVSSLFFWLSVDVNITCLFLVWDWSGNWAFVVEIILVFI